MQSERPQWLITAVQAAEAAAKRARPVRRGSGNAILIGPARPDPERGKGWFQVALRGERYDTDRVSGEFLSPEGKVHEPKYSVRESVLDGGLLRIRVADHIVREDLVLFASREQGTSLEQALLEGIRELRSNALIESFSKRSLARISPARGPQGFNAEQAAAWSAGVGEGLSLVWGPPGTGKTQVIGRIVEELLRQEKSVLLVSGTNVAVDNAIQRAAIYADPEPGVMLRIGTPHVPAVASDPRISMARLLEKKLAVLDEEAERLSLEIVDLRQDESVLRLAEVERALIGFDPSVYAEARKRIADHQTRITCEERLLTLGAQLDHQRRVEESARATKAVRERAWQATEQSRARHAEADGLQEELSGHVLDRDRAAVAENRLMSEWLQLSTELRALKGVRNWSRRRALEERILGVQRQAEAATVRREALDDLLSRSERELGRRISAARASARHSRDQIEEIRRQAGRARVVHDSAGRRLHALVEQQTQLEEMRNALTDRPTPEDHALVDAADSAGLPRLHRDLAELRRRSASVLQRITELESAHEKVLAARGRAGRDSERKLVTEARMIATTHTMLRLRKEINTRTYDFVIVDEAAASTSLEILYALGRGGEGAVLLGDFLQNKPIVDRELLQGSAPEVRAWMGDPFEWLGIKAAERAAATPGCVALTTQYRFGEKLNELANLVTYRGLLKVGRRREDQVVLIDVDGLGDELAGIRYEGGSATWPIGAMLAKALAERHLLDAGEDSVGVISPYKKQAELVEAYLADSDASPRIEVGTVHKFQGREFGTVVFDLVEQGHGWMSRGGPGAVEVLNVGSTRAQHRLYLIANGAAVERARTGPLRAVAAMVADRKIEVVRAAALLGRNEDEVPPAGAMYEVWDALRAYAKVVDILDEELLPAALCERIESAESSVWLWSAWVGKRSAEFVPLLGAAQNRGVKVRVIVRDDGTMSTNNIRGHRPEGAGQYAAAVAELRRQVRHVVRLRDEHQKIVVVDGRYVFLGSMNTLSHQRHGGTRDTMALFDSRSFASHILRHERADELETPKRCPNCTNQAEVSIFGRGRDRRLHWICERDHTRWFLPFTDLSTGRNQRT